MTGTLVEADQVKVILCDFDSRLNVIREKEMRTSKM